MSTQPDSKSTKLEYTHSEGPWRVHAHTDRPVRIWVARPDTYSVARVMTSTLHYLEAMGNAHLMSAAPDFYEIAKVMLSACRHCGVGVNCQTPFHAELKRVIAKAEGK